ncbi:hypothetical protein PQ460_08330 [Paenibacillus sp. KACC 21273]|uniref:hypothetical protein n=1 Tax=Paenibacillus sp. KACC 21273 TaxID=3025665 RepID=UPI002366DFF5|nr:hypothetical protein [Paenibacillus sp. KACC 21273]WDF52399.1 hypothetical protein PQ460_08330 [Paenibacillus sp. KACC 21273]
MKDIRLCTKPNLLFLHILEALSNLPYIAKLDIKQDTTEYATAEYFTFVMEDQSTLVHLINDQSTSIPYLLISGPACQQLAYDLYQSGLVYSSKDIVYRCLHDQHVDQKIDAICRLGIASYGEPSAEVLHIFELYLRDPDVRVRQSAVFATSFIGWQEFEKMLVYTASHDPDSRVAEIAESAIQIMRDSDWLSERA